VFRSCLDNAMRPVTTAIVGLTVSLPSRCYRLILHVSCVRGSDELLCAPRKNVPKTASLCVASEHWLNHVGSERFASPGKIALYPLSAKVDVILSATIFPGMADLFGPQTNYSGVSRVFCERLFQETLKFLLHIRTAKNLSLWTE
jgi:hypothetical protein